MNFRKKTNLNRKILLLSTVLLFVVRRFDSMVHNIENYHREDQKYDHFLLNWAMKMDAWETSGDYPLPEGPQVLAEFYKKGLELTIRANDFGVKILAGSDTNIMSGFELHHELQELVKAGLSPLESLQAATLHPAEYLNVSESYGSLAEGKVADVLLLDANPLQSIENTQKIDTVIFNGVVYDRTERQRLLEHVEEQAGSLMLGWQILWGFITSSMSSHM